MSAEKQKVFVKVRTLSDLTGAIMPEEIIWEGGRRYHIDEVPDVTWISDRVTAFTVRLGQERRVLYMERMRLETPQIVVRWYMEVDRG